MLFDAFTINAFKSPPGLLHSHITEIRNCSPKQQSRYGCSKSELIKNIKICCNKLVHYYSTTLSLQEMHLTAYKWVYSIMCNLGRLYHKLLFLSCYTIICETHDWVVRGGWCFWIFGHVVFQHGAQSRLFLVLKARTGMQRK